MRQSFPRTNPFPRAQLSPSLSLSTSVSRSLSLRGPLLRPRNDARFFPFLRRRIVLAVPALSVLLSRRYTLPDSVVAVTRRTPATGGTGRKRRGTRWRAGDREKGAEEGWLRGEAKNGRQTEARSPPSSGVSGELGGGTGRTRREGQERAFISNCNARSRNAWDPRDASIRQSRYACSSQPDSRSREYLRRAFVPSRTRIPATETLDTRGK